MLNLMLTHHRLLQDTSVRPHWGCLFPQRADAHSQTVGHTEIPQTRDLHAHGPWRPFCRHGGTPADGRGHPELHQDGGEEEEIVGGGLMSS